MPLCPRSPGGQRVVGRADSQCVRKLVLYRYTVGNRSVSFLRCGDIEDAIANQWAHWCGPFRGFPPVTIRPPSKNVGADALIGPPRNAVPTPAKSQLPGNPREVRTTFSAENGCCALRAPADIGCLLRNRIQNLPFRQRFAGKTVHLCCRSPHGERGLKSPAGTSARKAFESLPPRGAWIEIGLQYYDLLERRVAPPTGSVD